MADKKETIDEVAELKARLKAAEERSAEREEHIQDLEKKASLTKEATLTQKTIVEVDSVKYEVLAGCMIGGLKDKRELSKEDLANPKNKAVLEELIKKGSGLIRPL